MPDFALFLENVFHTWVLKGLQIQSGASRAASHTARIEMA